MIAGTLLLASRSAGGAAVALAGVCCYCRGGEGVEAESVYLKEKDRLLLNSGSAWWS